MRVKLSVRIRRWKKEVEKEEEEEEGKEVFKEKGGVMNLVKAVQRHPY